jgi:hypothetical protein
MSFVTLYSRSGQVDQLYPILMPTRGHDLPNLQDSYREHAPVLAEWREALADVSDGPVRWAHGRGLSGVAAVPAGVYPHRWSSAHEAAAGMAGIVLNLLVAPVAAFKDDAARQRAAAERALKRCWRALAVTPDEVADLQERIRRERAKVLRAAGGPAAPAIQSSHDSLSDNDETVLRALRHQHPRRVSVVDLAVATRIGDKTVKEVLRSLIARGLADRPSPRKGAAITDAGVELLTAADTPRVSAR